jgi:hypothetical protein
MYDEKINKNSKYRCKNSNKVLDENSYKMPLGETNNKDMKLVLLSL